ncbi:hypothetical protein GCM10009590_00840 [Brachybacterium alimentarium]
MVVTVRRSVAVPAEELSVLVMALTIEFPPARCRTDRLPSRQDRADGRALLSGSPSARGASRE